MILSKRTRNFLLIIRLSLGVVFLWSGISKVLSDFSAQGYLGHAVYGPFADIFSSLAGSKVVDLLVIWGEIAIGLSMLTGILLRLASFSGMTMMLLFYLSTFPPEHGLVNEQIIYALFFYLFGFTQFKRLRFENALTSIIHFVKKHSRQLMIVIGIWGALISYYLSLFTNENSIACPITSCEGVLSSKWATIGGMEVASLGIVFYVVLILLNIALLFSKEKLIKYTLNFWIGIGLLFSIFLRYIDLVILKEICMWCWISFLFVINLVIISLIENNLLKISREAD